MLTCRVDPQHLGPLTRQKYKDLWPALPRQWKTPTVNRIKHPLLYFPTLLQAHPPSARSRQHGRLFLHSLLLLLFARHLLGDGHTVFIVPDWFAPAQVDVVDRAESPKD